MVTWARAIDEVELIHLDLSLAWLEMTQGGSLESAARGFIRTMSALEGLPEAIALLSSSDSDR